MPPFSPARARTCVRRRERIPLSRQRAGTGRYAGLKVPIVCAHSPAYGDGDGVGGLLVPVVVDVDVDAVVDIGNSAFASPCSPLSGSPPVLVVDGADGDEEEEEEAVLGSAVADSVSGPLP